MSLDGAIKSLVATGRGLGGLFLLLVQLSSSEMLTSFYFVRVATYSFLSRFLAVPHFLA
jgi:hypothetical protein